MNTEIRSLSDKEISVLAIIMSHRGCFNSTADLSDSVSKSIIENEMSKGGFGLLETSMAIKRLLSQREMINETIEQDSSYNVPCAMYSLTCAGEGWLLDNEDNFMSRLNTSNN